MKRESQGISWTPEMDAVLREQFEAGKRVEEIAPLIGVSEASLRCRASRIGLKFKRLPPRPTKNDGRGHRAFTERCGEILRAHGVKI